MPELKGSKTEANLMTAFAGESQARNKYTYYASKAKKDGYVQIAALFEETANNEKEHAKIWFKLLHGGIGDTIDNLKVPLPARTMSGPTCTPALPRPPGKKGLTTLPTCSRVWPKLRRSTRSATSSW